MRLFLRAIITGFGYKLGAELGRYVVDKTGLNNKKKKGSNAASASGDMPEGMPPEPSKPDEDPETPDEPEDDEPEDDREQTIH